MTRRITNEAIKKAPATVAGAIDKTQQLSYTKYAKGATGRRSALRD